MSDVLPNYKVEQQRLRSQIASLRATLERQTLENMELDDRIQRNLVNIEATQKAILATEEKIEHFGLTPSEDN